MAPGGATALLVGDMGLLMRYVGDTHAVTNANGSNLLTGRNLIDVVEARVPTSPTSLQKMGHSWRLQRAQDQ